jgi:DNA-binding CsgD family transcriptional regulator
MQEHTQQLQSLEERIAIPPAPPMAFRQVGRRPLEGGARLPAQSFPAGGAQQFDIERFTEQQKRVLAVFFQNKRTWMSYADVAKVLNKSAYTVKNQMNQIRQKADLFERTIGSQSRNLFALKADLRVEKYLKVGQPTERPVSAPEPDQSEAQEAEPVVEYVYERSEPQEEG